jgi:hypothetical protein
MSLKDIILLQNQTDNLTKICNFFAKYEKADKLIAFLKEPSNKIENDTDFIGILVTTFDLHTEMIELLMKRVHILELDIDKLKKELLNVNGSATSET